MHELLKNATTEQFIIIFTTPLYTILVLGEILISNWQHRHFYTFKDTITNLYLMLLNATIDLLSRGFTWAILAWFFRFHFVQIQTPWLYWLALFIAEDFVYYWLHYFDHFSRLFWAVHVTHHSSEQFNLSVGFRSSVFQPLYRFLYFIPLVLLGFRVADLAVMYSITQIYGIIIHTNYVPKLSKTHLAWVEYILVTPSHHRVHHGSNVEYLDKNMGMCLIIWDKLFGTYQEEIADLPIKYGLVSAIENRNAFNIIFHEWLNIGKEFNKKISFTTKLKYLFMPPGWSHDGSTKTSQELRKSLSEPTSNLVKSV